jgi:hypothetical protein
MDFSWETKSSPVILLAVAILGPVILLGFVIIGPIHLVLRMFGRRGFYTLKNGVTHTWSLEGALEPR